MKDLKTLYTIAKEHKDLHKSCGGEPYKSYEDLYQTLVTFANGRENLHALEIGTAVGFTTYLLQCAISPRQVGGWIDTIEFHQEHIDLAKENIINWGGNISNINFLTGDALNVLPTLLDASYDIIFFDGYGVKGKFYEQFKRLIKPGGLLVVCNIFLKSTESSFFQNLQNDQNLWDLVKEFADTKVFNNKKNVM
jgi:predicted O-methyltransferase YrrM